jgi:hypothetical protein
METWNLRLKDEKCGNPLKQNYERMLFAGRGILMRYGIS